MKFHHYHLKEIKNESLGNSEIQTLINYVGKHTDVPDSEFDQEQLWKGTLVEFEHIPDSILEEQYDLAISIAKNIAKDHISENLQYYEELEKMESKFSESVQPQRKRDLLSVDTMFEFFGIASPSEKIEMKKIMDRKDYEDYIKLVKRVFERVNNS